MPSRTPVLSALALAAALIVAACSGPEAEPSPASTVAGDSAATASPTATLAPSSAPPSPPATVAGASAATASPRPSTPSPQATPSPAAPSAGPGTDATFSTANAMRHAVMLAETIGVRVSGTEGERKAVAYLRAQLESFGYTVSVDSFTYEERTFRTAEVNAGGKVYQALTMVGSAVATVTAPAAFVGLADEAGLAGADLTGKVAVADRGVLTFAQKVEAVRAAGAVALIVINNEPGDLSGQLSGNSDLAVAGLAQEDGAALRAAARAGQPVRLKTTGTEQRTGLDVIARPAAGAACDIVVGGHHDTVPGAPGAHDNASGTAAVVELARAAAVGGLEPGVCFVAFGAEESGLFGSQDFVAKLETAGALPKFMLNIDMMGEGTRVDLVGTTTLVRQAAVIAERLGIPAQETTLGAQFGSDHQPFQRKGVLVVFFTSNEPGRFHTPHDTADRLQPAAIGRVGEIAFALIQDLVKQTG